MSVRPSASFHLPNRRRAGRAAGWVVLAATLLAVGMSAISSARAVQLERTRVVVAQKDGSASINARNTAKQPVLLQVWVEAGEAASQGKPAVPLTAAHADAQVPFIVDPPIVRLEPNETRALQVWLSRDTLPADRESQFWLNVLQVPAIELPEDGQAAEQGGNRLDISIVTRIKVFWRPEKLTGSNYKWSEKDAVWLALEKDEQNQHWLVINNPSPYHLSVDKLTVYEGDSKAKKADKTEIPAPVDALMLLPFGKQKIKLAQAPTKPETVHAVIVYIGDWGELLEMEPLAVKMQQG